MNKKEIFIHNDSFGIYENHYCFDLNEAIVFANKAALYQYEANEAEYKEAIERYNRLLESPTDIDTAKWFTKPNKPENFTIQVMIKTSETKDDYKFRNLYSISRNKIREMKHFHLIYNDHEWAPY